MGNLPPHTTPARALVILCGLCLLGTGQTLDVAGDGVGRVDGETYQQQRARLTRAWELAIGKEDSMLAARIKVRAFVALCTTCLRAPPPPRRTPLRPDYDQLTSPWPRRSSSA